MDEFLGKVRFTDSVERSIYQEGAGRQYVLDDDDNRVHGLWLIPEDEPDLPVIVDTDRP